MGDWEGLNPDFAARLKVVADTCGVDVGSGFRTRDEQARLYAQKPTLAAPPGHSNHEQGMAADLQMPDGSSLTPEAYACIKRTAPAQGLVQPMSHEPWHWEPAGVNASGQAYTQPAEGLTAPPSDPAANAVAAFMDSVLTGGAGGLPDVSGLAAPEAALPATPGAPATEMTSATAVATSTGGDWQASLTPAERWILTKESGLDPTAQNPSSTAFGIWQGLESTRRQYLGDQWETTDPTLQLDAFRRYVKDRYGTAEAAKAFHEANGWY